MPRQSLDACMFCSDNPCSCEGSKLKKKASPRKGRKAGGEGVPTTQPPSPPVNTVDLKAAMKAALTTPKPVVDSHHQPEALTVRDQTEKPIDEEFAQALNNLVPILHPTELRTHAEILNRPDLRAIRWRRRNG